MSYKTKEEIMNRVKEHYKIAQGLGYEIIGVFLQGSFNYGEDMSDEQSDIDTKCLVVPKFKDFCLNKSPTSTTHICENNEHIDIKDFRVYFQCFMKQNVNFVEILFTEYKVINPKYESIVNKLIEHREEIAHYSNSATLNCICGMGYEKYKALEHPYPATKDKIEKYGFDGKQLSHIIRLYEFMARWIAGEPYSDCLISKQQKYIRNIKRNTILDLESARDLAKNFSNKMKEAKDEYLAKNKRVVDKNVENLFEEVSVEILKIYLTGEFNNGLL